MPYPNEHACRLKDPGQYDRFNRENCGQKHDGKCIDVIYGIKEGKSEIQALRYPKDSWTAAAAKSHCDSRDGTFEAASDSRNADAPMKRAYSVLNFKSIDEKARRFTGIASTPNTDRVGDIVEPEGAQFSLPLPLLWQHRSAEPIGWIDKAKVTSSGIEVEGEIPNIPEDGDLKNRLLTAWQTIKAKLVRGLSIGFREIESSDIKGTWGMRFTKWEWLELSVVTIPANSDATIQTIKRFDNEALAAIGRQKNIPGVTGKQIGGNMKTIQEQLAEFKEAKKTKMARMNELAEIVKNESRDWTEEESGEFSVLEEEIKQLDGDIRQKTVEAMNAASAKSIIPDAQDRAASKSRGITVISKKDKDEAFKGQNFTRMVIAKALGRLEDVSPVVIAERRWGKTNPTLIEVIKAAVSGADSTTATWAAELVQSDTRYTGDFIEYLKEKTIFDRLPLREVPANVTIKGRDGAATGYWVGEAAAIPVSAAEFKDVSLTPLKVAALAVLTNELIRDSSPAAEMLVRDALVEASAQRVDATFFGAAAAAAGVSPAGMLNAVVALPSNGVDGTALRADIRDLYAPFIAAFNASNLVLAMNPALAKSIQLLSNALGIQEFPGISQDGGTLLGDRVFTGDNITATYLILMRPADIYKIGDSGVSVAISREAMIEMDDSPAMDSQAPTGHTGAAVSMFQTESTAIKIVRSINFQKRRAGVVQYINDATYGGASGS